MVTNESLYVALHDVLVTRQKLLLVYSRASVCLGIEAPIRPTASPLFVRVRNEERVTALHIEFICISKG